MQRITLTIPVGSCSPGDTFRVYSDADARGKVTGTVNYARPITGAAGRPYWPLAPKGPGFLEGPFLQTPFLGVPSAAPPDLEVVTPALYLGAYHLVLRGFDVIGNASDDQHMLIPINSGPGAPRRFRQTSVNDDGRPVFAFDAPAQLAD